MALTTQPTPIDSSDFLAWLIDDTSLRFVPVKGNVQCTGEGYAGNEGGSDVLGRARERAQRERSQ